MASNLLGFGSYALGLAHVAAMGPMGVAVPIASMALRALANRATLNSFDRLQCQTALRSALGRQALAGLPAPAAP
jgi:hypothetical protein